jgi:hypothetical protein
MKLRQSIFLPIALIMIAGLVACGGSSSTPPPPPPPPSISVAISPAPPASLAPLGQTSLTAVVSNDTANGGVNWSCAPAGACGTFAPANPIASGTAVTYTAPATGSVTVTATSVTAPTKSASATITITTPVASLNDGTYVYFVSGVDNNPTRPSPYAVAGAFTVASGAITGGEQDFGDFFSANHDNINAATSSISSASNGNLIVMLDTGDTSIGVAGVETFSGSLSGSLAASSRALITEFDTWASGSGTLDLQTSIAAPTGGYAFVLSGVDNNGLPLSIGGVLKADGSGNITSAGSAFDINDAGGTALDQGFNASTISAADPFGLVEFKLTPNSASGILGIVLEGYIVDATHIRLVEGLDAFIGTTGGTALGQGANTGTFTAGGVSGQTYVTGLQGFLSSSAALQIAGAFTLNSGSTVGGTINYNALTGSGTQAPAAVTGGTYSIDALGRVTMSGVTDGIQPFNIQLYLDGNGNALSATMDSFEISAGSGFLQTGAGSFSASSFSGTYALNANGADLATESRFDAVGPVAADGSATFAGAVDYNAALVLTSNAAVSGTFTADPSGVFTGTITGLDFDTPANADAFTYYLVDSTKVVAIETDPNQLTLGYFEVTAP